MKRTKVIGSLILLILSGAFYSACNYSTHRTISRNISDTSFEVEPDPDYNVSLDPTYQDFVSFMFMGNRSENFATYFNSYYLASEDFNDALSIYRTTTIATYNKRLDSLNITPVLSKDLSDKFDKVIQRASKVIQLHKNSKFLDDAVLLVGKTYYFLADYIKAERQLNEFLSNLQSSRLYDEAILYLGMTKLKLGKIDEGEKILKNILVSAKDKEIRSEAAQQLGINEYSKKNYNQAIGYFRSSIEVSNNKESKAIKQFILAKMYSIIDPVKAAVEFSNVDNYTSDYDQTFYARLNNAKGLNYLKRYPESLDELASLRKKYRESPDYRQLVDLEVANTYFYQGKFSDAIHAYYDVIIDYPGSIASADAYYYLGKYYEQDKNNYLSAAIFYKKATTENGQGDFNDEALKKAESFERYYALLATINDKQKIEIPAEDVNLERYRTKRNKEKGIDTKTNKTDPNLGDPKERGGKGSGISSKEFSFLRDSIINKLPPGSENLFKIDSNNNNNFIPKDTINKNFRPTEFDQLNKTDTTQLDPKLLKNDTSKINIPIKVDSAKTLYDKRYNAYYELAELFLYDLKQVDSAEYYLNTIIERYNEPERNSKAMYALATIYLNNNESGKANELFQKIIQTYPNTVFANESRKSLGFKTQEVEEETVKELYKAAEKSFLDGRNDEALMLLTDLNSKYPESAISPKILYTKGWIYENNLKNRDSAIVMYRLLKQKYPSSEFTLVVNPKLDQIPVNKIQSDSTMKLPLDTAIKNLKTQVQSDTSVVVTDSLGNVINRTSNPPEETKPLIKEEQKDKSDDGDSKKETTPLQINNETDTKKDPVETPK